MPDDAQVFNEYGISAAGFWALTGDDPEKEKALQGLDGIAVWQEMRVGDHTVAAMLAGLTLPIRRASWDVEPASSKPADEEAAEFLSQCMDDMSHSWDALIVDALTFFPFGWSWLEQVMKKRSGLTPLGDTARSKYTDGRIGWRKVVLRPQSTLSHWLLDDHGGIQALYQNVPNKSKPVPIPIQRSLLFRTTTEGNLPEAVSILRPSWRPYTHRKRLEMVEGMAFTRNLAGVIKTKLGPGATTIAGAGQQSDEHKAQTLIEDAYNDRLVGIIETDQVEVSVMEGPRGTQFRSIGQAITRKDTEMARAILAHFIMIGLQQRGSYGLAKDESDLFLMAVMAYLETMTAVIQRFAVERLFRVNIFPNITEIPQIASTTVYKPDLGELAKAINDLVSAQLLTIDDTLEEYIRSLANFPDLPADLTRENLREQGLLEEPGLDPPKPDQPASEKEGVAQEKKEELSQFAVGGGRPRKYIRATRKYEEDLQEAYLDWTVDTAKNVGKLSPDITEEELWPHLDDWLAVGLLLLMEKGYQDLLAAFVLGFGSPSIGPEGLRVVEDAQTKNDTYLAGSLFEDIRGKLEGEVAAILLLLKYGRPQDVQSHLEAVFLSLDWRLPLYAGTYWEVIHAGIGEKLTKRGTITGPVVRRVLDPLAKHCITCPPKAREYNSWDDMVAEAGKPGDGSDECDGRCRCGVQELRDGHWVWIA